MHKRPIRILVVEDSAVTREFLVKLLGADPAFQVVGTAANGETAVDFLQRNKVDVITMDINMPQMDGFEATRRIMETQPTPVVIVTANTDPREVATTFRAMEAGALAVLPMPAGFGHPEHFLTVQELIGTIKAMAEVKVIRRWSRARGAASAGASRITPHDLARKQMDGVEIVAIGASTGGPLVLQTILSKLPSGFPAPIVIVQHIATGFLLGFVEWLKSTSGIVIGIAQHREILAPGHAYLAPDHRQMVIGPNGIVYLRDDPPEHGLRPSVSCLFRSIAANFGRHSVGVLLTGMGRDGADELKQIKDRGGVTIAQSAASCVVNGMPGEAVKIGAACYVLSPEKIPTMLVSLVKS